MQRWPRNKNSKAEGGRTDSYGARVLSSLLFPCRQPRQQNKQPMPTCTGKGCNRACLLTPCQMPCSVLVVVVGVVLHMAGKLVGRARHCFVSLPAQPVQSPLPSSHVCSATRLRKCSVSTKASVSRMAENVLPCHKEWGMHVAACLLLPSPSHNCLWQVGRTHRNVGVVCCMWHGMPCKQKSCREGRVLWAWCGRVAGYGAGMARWEGEGTQWHGRRAGMYGAVQILSCLEGGREAEV